MGEQLTFEFEQRPTIKGFPELRCPDPDSENSKSVIRRER